VSRYGPGGEFWAEHPELERLPARAWQIWNEPNNPDFWLPRPAASQYVGLLAAAERAIHRADPAAEVIGGELFPAPYIEGGVPMAPYLADLYALGGSAYLDGVGVHPYAGRPERAFEIVAEARAIMDRNGDAEKPIWITELGWATGGDPSTVTVSEPVQADYLRRSLALATARRGSLRLAAMTWFSLEDQAGASWPERTGLWREDGSAKPSWQALVEATGGGWDSRLQAAARRLGEQLLAAARRL
jgi:hypothetical protein